MDKRSRGSVVRILSNRLRRTPVAIALAGMAGGLWVAATTVPAGANPVCSSTTVWNTSELDSSLGGSCSTIYVEQGTFAGPFTIDRNVSIVGESETTTVLKGGDAVVTVTGGTVSISNLTITGGTDSATLNGGGVDNESTLTLDNVLVTANTSTAAGIVGNCVAAAGIFSEGAMAIENSAITRNDASGKACVGGVYNDGTTMVIENTIISDNFASGPEGDAGGLLNNSVTDLLKSTVTDNSSPTTGGIDNFGTLLYLSGTSVTGNTGGSEGGGIWNDQGLTVLGGLIAGNTAFAGGGIYNEAGTVTMKGPGGVDDNFATSGGGIYSDGGTVSLSQTTVQHNKVDQCEGTPSC